MPPRYTIHAPSDLDPKVFADWLQTTTGLLGLDVETTALSEDGKAQWAEDFRVRTIQLGSAQVAWVLDAQDPKAVRCFQLALGQGKRFVTHTDYDLRSLYCGLGVDLSAVTVDAYVLACLVNPGGTNDLKTWSKRLGPELVVAEDALIERGKALAPVGERVGYKDGPLKRFIFNEIDIDDEAFVTYAGLDAIFVHNLHQLLTDKAQAMGMSHLIDREQRYSSIFVRKGIRGTTLDLNTAQTIFDETHREHEKARAGFEAATGLKALSPKRPQWFAEHGADLSQAPPTDGTKDKPKDEQTAKFDKATLPMLAAENDTAFFRPIWADLLTVSRTKNLRDNLKNMIRSADAEGRGHPITKTQGAKTGRASVTKIPIQTFKKKDPRLRSIILADAGNTFVGADFDGVEWRVAAALSGDPILTGLLNAGEDLHDSTARAVFGPDYTDEQKKLAKGLGFGTLYGGGAVTLAGQTGQPVETTREQIYRIKDAYPVCFAFLNKVGQQRGISTPWGRKILADPDRGYALGNYLIQSSAREILVDAVLRLLDDYRIPETWIELCVHDEIILQVPNWAIDYALAALNAAMNITFRGVAITATSEVYGSNWGKTDRGQEVAAA